MLTLLLAAALQSHQTKIYTFDRGRYQVWMSSEEFSDQAITSIDRKLKRRYVIKTEAAPDPDPVLIRDRSIVVGLGNLRSAHDDTEAEAKRSIVFSELPKLKTVWEKTEAQCGRPISFIAPNRLLCLLCPHSRGPYPTYRFV